MKTALILLAIVALILIGVPALCTWALERTAREEERQIRQQLEEDRFAWGGYDDHDVSGLIEED